MNVEVNIDGVHYPALAERISKEGNSLETSYPGDWRPRETVNVANCRVLQAQSSHPIHKGDVIEALFEQTNGQSGWQRASVREIKADFIVVDSVEGPQHTDVVAANKCRNGAVYTQFSAADLRTDSIGMTRHYFGESSRSFVQKICRLENELAQSRKLVEELRNENAILRKRLTESEHSDTRGRIEALIDERIKKRTDRVNFESPPLLKREEENCERVESEIRTPKVRPRRAAALKIKSYAEPQLKGKLWRPSKNN
uniref:DUF2213 domain-containing protein n=1 Tax=Haemonchus contortus TaxID=6289 RepID=A0A7I4Y1A5_HAECO